jgi:hypothetical protein
LADKYKELSSQFELRLMEVREVADNSLYRADLSVVGLSWLLQLQETYSQRPLALAMAC